MNLVSSFITLLSGGLCWKGEFLQSGNNFRSMVFSEKMITITFTDI